MKQPESQEILALWQATWPEQLPLLAGLEQRLGDPMHMRWRRSQSGELTALALFRPPENHPHGHLRLLLVHPTAQRQGLGRELVDETRAALPGLTLALGEERGHFLPGCTASSLPFWEACGFVPSGRVSVDMACDLRRELPPANLPPHLRLTDAREEGIGAGVLKLTDAVFSRRWTQDAQAVLDRAPWQVLALVGGTSESRGEVVGFALTGLESDPATLPSFLYPENTRRVTGATGLVGGLGPVGLHSDLRGGGLGRGLMLACMAHLHQRGAEAMGIDWTGIAPFYEKLGFAESCQYIHARG